MQRYEEKMTFTNLIVKIFKTVLQTLRQSLYSLKKPRGLHRQDLSKKKIRISRHGNFNEMIKLF